MFPWPLGGDSAELSRTEEEAFTKKKKAEVTVAHGNHGAKFWWSLSTHILNLLLLQWLRGWDYAFFSELCLFRRGFCVVCLIFTIHERFTCCFFSRFFCIATLLTVSRHSWVTFYDFVEDLCSIWKVAFGKNVHRNELLCLVRGSRRSTFHGFMCVTWPRGSRLQNKMSRGFAESYRGLLSQVSILYFAKSAELTGVKAEEIAAPTPLSSQQLWGLLLQRHPRCCGPLKATFVHFCVCTHAYNLLSVCV